MAFTGKKINTAVNNKARAREKISDLTKNAQLARDNVFLGVEDARKKTKAIRNTIRSSFARARVTGSRKQTLQIQPTESKA